MYFRVLIIRLEWGLGMLCKGDTPGNTQVNVCVVVMCKTCLDKSGSMAKITGNKDIIQRDFILSYFYF